MEFSVRVRVFLLYSLTNIRFLIHIYYICVILKNITHYENAK